MSIRQKSTEILNFEIYADITCGNIQKNYFLDQILSVFYDFGCIRKLISRSINIYNKKNNNIDNDRS